MTGAVLLPPFQGITGSGAWQPSDSGYAAATYDPASGGTARLPAAGVINLFAFYIRQTQPVTKLRLILDSNGSGLTAGENWAGLYSPAGILIGLSADQTTAWGSGAVKAVDAPLTAQAGQSLILAPGIYPGALVANGATIPGFESDANTNATWLNGISSGAALRFATNGTGTTLPDSLTLSSSVAAQVSWFAALLDD